MLKMLLVRSQKGVSKALLKCEGTRILVTLLAESLAEILPELYSSVGYIAQDISMQSVGDATCLLAAYSKM